MIHVQRYSGKRVKDGSEVRGYAALSYDGSVAWIMVPTKGAVDKFSAVEVRPDSLIPIM